MVTEDVNRKFFVCWFFYYFDVFVSMISYTLSHFCDGAFPLFFSSWLLLLSLFHFFLPSAPFLFYFIISHPLLPFTLLTFNFFFLFLIFYLLSSLSLLLLFCLYFWFFYFSCHWRVIGSRVCGKVMGRCGTHLGTLTKESGLLIR